MSANSCLGMATSATLLRKVSEVEGPDFPARVASGGNVAELGLIGQIALDGGSVGSALHRVAEAQPVQTSHATVTAHAVPNGVIVRHAWLVRMDADMRTVRIARTGNGDIKVPAIFILIPSISTACTLRFRRSRPDNNRVFCLSVDFGVKWQEVDGKPKIRPANTV